MFFKFDTKDMPPSSKICELIPYEQLNNGEAISVAIGTANLSSIASAIYRHNKATGQKLRLRTSRLRENELCIIYRVK